MIDLLLRNVVVDGLDEQVSVGVDDGHIVELGTNVDKKARREIAGHGRYLIPGFVESHLHLDIIHSNDARVAGRQQEFDSMAALTADVEARRKAYTYQDIVQRAVFALQCALRHGTTAVRAQCHVDPEVGLDHLRALQTVKEQVADWMTLEIVVFPQQGLLQDVRLMRALTQQAFDIGADVMGGAADLDISCDFKEHVDLVFELARTSDRDVDIHVDLSLRADAEWEDLEVAYVAQRAVENGYHGRVTASHANRLDSVRPEIASQVIALLNDAGVSVVSQPDLYRLGREDRQHVRRGLTRVKEMLSAGVNVAYASNNVRDPMRPFGNLDLLEEGLILAYGSHMDTVEELRTLLKMCTYNAAKILRLPNYGLAPGSVADMVLLDARSASAAVVDQAEKAVVVKSGLVRAVSERTTTLDLA